MNPNHDIITIDELFRSIGERDTKEIMPAWQDLCALLDVALPSVAAADEPVMSPSN